MNSDRASMLMLMRAGVGAASATQWAKAFGVHVSMVYRCAGAFGFKFPDLPRHQATVCVTSVYEKRYRNRTMAVRIPNDILEASGLDGVGRVRLVVQGNRIIVEADA